MPEKAPDAAESDGFEFEDSSQHTIENLDRLDVVAHQEASTPRDSLLLTLELLSHGHPETPRWIARVREHPHRDAAEFADAMQDCFDQLRARFRIEDVSRDELVWAYRKDGHMLFESEKKSRKLLVAFMTIYNNFFISNLNFHAMLKGLGCHLLLLKESTLAHYQRGVPGFAPDYPSIADQIQAMADKLGADQIYLTGFSSGGYPALHMSLKLPCRGYLGFSHATDMSLDSPLQRPLFVTEEVYARLDQRWLLDLRIDLERADPAVPRMLLYGDRATRDTAHARHLAGLNTIRATPLAGVGHNTIQNLLYRRRLIPAFKQLLGDL